jgi:hypothetical protein
MAITADDSGGASTASRLIGVTTAVGTEDVFDRAVRVCVCPIRMAETRWCGSAQPFDVEKMVVPAIDVDGRFNRRFEGRSGTFLLEETAKERTGLFVSMSDVRISRLLPLLSRTSFKTSFVALTGTPRIGPNSAEWNNLTLLATKR